MSPAKKSTAKKEEEVTYEPPETVIEYVEVPMVDTRLVLEKLLDLEPELQAYVAVPDGFLARPQAAVGNVLGAISHLKDALAQDASARKPGHPDALNRERVR